MRKSKMENKRSCKMCGIQLPPINYYDTDWCWMCWRTNWEEEYHRYYLKTENDSALYEEVQSLRGLFAFGPKNKPLIQKEMKKARNKSSQQ